MPDDFGISKTPVLQVDPLARQIPQGASPRLADFADKVKQVSKGMQTGPFQGKVAIGELYDAFSKAFPRSIDPLGSFKVRLVNAAKARLLELHRLDMPEMMDKNLRTKSEAKWGDDSVHFLRTDDAAPPQEGVSNLSLEKRLTDKPL